MTTDLRSWLIAGCCCLATGLAGCEPYSGPRTHVEDAVLSPEAIARARSSEAAGLGGGGGDAGARCAQAQSAVEQLASLGPSLFRPAGPGVLDVDARVWQRLPQPQRTSLLQLLATGAQCARAPAGVVRDINTRAVLARRPVT